MDLSSYDDILVQQILKSGITKKKSKCVSILREYNYDLEKITMSYGVKWDRYILIDIKNDFIEKDKSSFYELRIFQDEIITSMLASGRLKTRRKCIELLEGYKYDLTRLSKSSYAIRWNHELLKKINKSYADGTITRNNHMDEIRSIDRLIDNLCRDSDTCTKKYEILSNGDEFMSNTTFFNGGLGDPNVEHRLNNKYPWRKNRGNTTFFNGGVGDEQTRRLREKYEWYGKNTSELKNVNFDDGELVIEDLSVLTGIRNEGIVESIITAPFKAIRGIGDYLLVDQEKEGREAGICVATKQYEPILHRIEARYVKLKWYDDQRSANYESRCDVLEQLFIKYKDDIRILSGKIDRIKDKSQKASDFLSNIGYIGLNSNCSSGIGAGFNNISVFGKGAVTASGGLAGLATSMAGVSLFFIFGSFLDSRNQKKYNKYFKIAYEETSVKYQSKINREKEKIAQIIQSIKMAEKENNEILNKLNQALQDVIQEYAELNAVLSMIRGYANGY